MIPALVLLAFLVVAIRLWNLSRQARVLYKDLRRSERSKRNMARKIMDPHGSLYEASVGEMQAVGHAPTVLQSLVKGPSGAPMPDHKQRAREPEIYRRELPVDKASSIEDIQWATEHQYIVSMVGKDPYDTGRDVPKVINMSGFEEVQLHDGGETGLAVPAKGPSCGWI